MLLKRTISQFGLCLSAMECMAAKLPDEWEMELLQPYPDSLLVFLHNDNYVTLTRPKGESIKN